jgi:Transposase DDE domain group 1
VRLQLHALAYNLANFLRSLTLPQEVEQWSLTTLRERLVKIGARIVRHGRYVVFQLAEVAVPRALFAAILRRSIACGDRPWRRPDRSRPWSGQCRGRTMRRRSVEPARRRRADLRRGLASPTPTVASAWRILA